MAGETAWTLIAGMALIAFLTRGIFVLPGSRLRLPPTMERVLRYAPAAALMAIIVPDLALPLDGFAGNEPEEDVTRWTVSRMKLPHRKD